MLAGNLRVQEYIERSGRYHLSRDSYDNIKSALFELRVRTRKAYNSYGMYGKDNVYTNNAEILTDSQTYFIVRSPNGAQRRFTLVLERKGESVPFGHLMRKQEIAR